jgi:molybdopterin biosynthesis enzyme
MCLPVLHACGIESVTVHEPRVAIICCGDALVADPARDGLGLVEIMVTAAK